MLSLRNIDKILVQHQQDLAGKGVRELSIFGSFARKEATKESDVDILIDFDSTKGIFAFVELKHYLETLLHCEVDLVSKKALHPALKHRILAEAKHVF